MNGETRDGQGTRRWNRRCAAECSLRGPPARRQTPLNEARLRLLTCAFLSRTKGTVPRRINASSPSELGHQSLRNAGVARMDPTGGGFQGPNPRTMLEMINRLPEKAVFTVESFIRYVHPVTTTAIAMRVAVSRAPGEHVPQPVPGRGHCR